MYIVHYVMSPWLASILCMYDDKRCCLTTPRKGVTKDGAPGYCSPWDCLPAVAGWASRTFDGMIDDTGWAVAPMVVFSPCATATGVCQDSKVAGGLMNSVAGFDGDRTDIDWEAKMHPVCGKLVAQQG